MGPIWLRILVHFSGFGFLVVCIHVYLVLLCVQVYLLVSGFVMWWLVFDRL